jgi:hypothetical protein
MSVHTDADDHFKIVTKHKELMDLGIKLFWLLKDDALALHLLKLTVPTMNSRDYTLFHGKAIFLSLMF